MHLRRAAAMAEDDELTLTPILVVDFSPVFGGNGAHDSFLASDARDQAFRDALRATEIVRIAAAAAQGRLPVRCFCFARPPLQSVDSPVSCALSCRKRSPATRSIASSTPPGLAGNPFVQTKLVATSMLPRVALEYGQIWCASSTSVRAMLCSMPGRLTLRRMLRK